MIKPIFEALAKQYTNVKFLKVDVDEASDVAQAFGIKAMSVFLLFEMLFCPYASQADFHFPQRQQRREEDHWR
jgi:thioredoxin 1